MEHSFLKDNTGTSMKKTTVDQKTVDKFIAELVGKFVNEYGENIDFIILYGSAAKGEFVKGASDIDLAIQLKEGANAQEISKFATELFWTLDAKHVLGFKSYLANAKSENMIESVFRKAENKTFLYTPLFILESNDLDWENGKVLRKDWAFLSKLFLSTGTMFLKFKNEGKVLYGRDIRDKITVKMSFWERWKGICIPVYLSLLAILIYPLSWKKSVKYTTKALLWGVDSTLVYLNTLVGQRNEQVEELQKQATFDLKISQVSKILDLYVNLRYRMVSSEDFEIVNEAVYYKKKGFDVNHMGSFSYVWKGFLFIIKLNRAIIFRSAIGKKE